MNLEEDYSFWEDEKGKGKPPPQEQSFLAPPPYNHHRRGGGWPPDASHSHVVGEPSSSRIDPMMAEDSSLIGGEEEPGKTTSPAVVEREHMFDKAVTPSDVGKLNRLVIPKQHAERYFPLDSATNDKGLLLNFEDRNGKLWRFRYSYWNSSQSYVMTKGWSRFVKEKKLDAGDIVSFQRGVGLTGKDRLFIDWRRRLDSGVNTPPSSNLSFPLIHHQNVSFHNRMNGGFNTHPWNPLILQSHPWRNPNLMLPPTTGRGGPYGGVMSKNGSSRSVIYFGSDGCRTPQQQQQQIQLMQMQQRRGLGLGLGFGVGIDPPPLPPPPPPPLPPPMAAASGKRRLRLFGVNMDCSFSEEDHDQEDDPPSELNPNFGDHNRSPPLIPPPSSSSHSTIPYLQLRPYDQGGNECNQSTILSSSSASTSGDHAFKIFPKSTTSNMSLDLDI